MATPVVAGFEVRELLGSGGFGEVYRAHHVLMGRDVAIKVLHARYSEDADAIARLLVEARAIGKLSHPNIVGVHDVGQLADGRYFIAMELVRGSTLRAILDERGHVPLDEALPILRGIAAAVDAAHAEGIAHRDLKPDNVFVLADGAVKLIDFGLAKLPRDDASPVTQTGTIFGTPLYMSPEQCRGGTVDPRTDAYSFGVLAYHVLAGAPPWTGEALELALHHLNDAPPPPSSRRPELVDRVDRVVLALMAKDPAQRPSPLAVAIDAIAGDASLPPRPRTPRRRAPWIAAAGVLVAGAGAFALLQSRSGDTVIAADPDCPSAMSKLVNVWDAPLRTHGETRFLAAGRDDVTTAWKVLSGNLDRYAGQWSTQWNAACVSEDRTRDLLLHAQRLACLDDALGSLGAVVRHAVTSDVRIYADGYPGGNLMPVLDDCESISVLRAQPPIDRRDEVVQLVGEVERARTELRTAINAGRDALIEPGVERLERAAAALDTLGAPQAAPAWYWRAHMLLVLGRSLRVPVERVRPAIDKAVERAIALRNDPWLVWARNKAAELARWQGGDREVDDAIARLAEAVERAGRPLRGRLDVLRLRIDIALARGDHARAHAYLDEVRPLIERLEPGEAAIHVRIDIDNERRGGRLQLAIDKARDLMAMERAVWGPESRHVDVTRSHLERALWQAGDHRGALGELEATIAFHARADAAPNAMRWLRANAAALALLAGDDARATRHIEAIAGETASAVPYLLVSRVGLQHGHPAVMRWALARARTARGASDAERTELWGSEAALAHAVGDTVTLRALRSPDAAMGSVADEGNAILADALDGSFARARQRLNAWRSTDPALDAEVRALVFREGRDHRAAMPHLEAWRSALLAHPGAAAIKQSAALHVDAYLGEARLELGDARAAIPMLEETLDNTTRFHHGFMFTTPIAQLALARALWDTGGDRERARRLAEQARDGYASLGPGRARDKQAAERWLADHPL